MQPSKPAVPTTKVTGPWWCSAPIPHCSLAWLHNQWEQLRWIQPLHYKCMCRYRVQYDGCSIQQSSSKDFNAILQLVSYKFLYSHCNTYVMSLWENDSYLNKEQSREQLLEQHPDSERWCFIQLATKWSYPVRKVEKTLFFSPKLSPVLLEAMF